MKKTIMYCPLNDGHVVAEIQKFAQTTFEERVDGFKTAYGMVTLEGSNAFQSIICNLPVIDIENSDILLFDKVVADYDHQRRLDIFWEKNKMELQKPSVQQSTERELYFVVAALMQLKAHWDKKYRAEKYMYDIPPEDAYTKEKLKIKGYRLRSVELALDHGFNEVSARIRLGHDIDIRLSDITAFGSKDLEILDENHLYDLSSSTELRYRVSDGRLIAPCIDETLIISNHLKNINWNSRDSLYQVYVESSEALTKLKLNEIGVEARAETIATSRILLTCCASSAPRSYSLTIKHGLVVDIRYKNKPIFVAYVPQEKFITQ
jgi:hypothetical protein